MTDPRTALDRLTGALEAFYEAARATQDPDAESVLEASDRVADAYTIFDDAIFTSFGIESPLDIYFDDDDEEDDDFDDDFDDDIDDIDEDDLYDDDEDDFDDIEDIDEDDLDD